jgi:hypothetical protein
MGFTPDRATASPAAACAQGGQAVEPRVAQRQARPVEANSQRRVRLPSWPEVDATPAARDHRDLARSIETIQGLKEGQGALAP